MPFFQTTMRKQNILLCTLLLLVSVSACSFVGTDTRETTNSSSSSPSLEVTTNVSYTGVLKQKAMREGVSSGTHELHVDGGTIVYLESNDVHLDLNSYIDSKVEIRGSAVPIEPTGTTLLRVQEITVVEQAAPDSSTVVSTSSSSDSSSSPSFCGGTDSMHCPLGTLCVDDLTDDCDPTNGGVDCRGVCVVSIASSAAQASSSSTREYQRLTTASSSEKSVALAPSSLSSKESVQTSSASLSSSSQSSASSIASKEGSTLMAKQKYSDANLWTQKYCTSHIGYCVSAHNNCYFKSFGATTSSLWHVEFGMSEIQNLNDGIIVMKLLDKSSAAVGGKSGSVQESAGEAIGFSDWNSQHFEISGPSSLREAISLMVSSIKPYNPGE